MEETATRAQTSSAAASPEVARIEHCIPERGGPRKFAGAGAALVVVASSAIAIAVPASGPADADAFEASWSGLVAEIESIVGGQEMGSAKVGIDVVDVGTGRRIYGREPDRSLNPASNVKIVTAWAALEILHPEYRWRTTIFGDAGSGSVLSTIALKGTGDPSFTSDDLAALVRDLRERGVTRVSGPIVVDDTFFDDVRLPFAFDRFPPSDADSPFRAPVGAVSVDANTMIVKVGPGSLPGAAARVGVFPPGYAEVKNETMTVEGGVANLRIQSTVTAKGVPIVRVWGPVPVTEPTQSFDKRVDDPTRSAGYALKEMLLRAGIESGDPVASRVPAQSKILATHESEPLSVVLMRVGKNSDNFFAEQILKTIGAEARGAPGTAEKAIEAVSEALARAGIDPASMTYRNGSGLYDANLVAPSHFTRILARAWMEPEIRSEFVAHLATGGIDGTLVHRYQDESSKRRVRAKTGTLDDTASLSGYVLAPAGGAPVAFSIIVNDVPGRVAVFRSFQEKIVTAIARFLWVGYTPPAT